MMHDAFPDELLLAIWQRLSDAVGDRAAAFRTATLGTTGADGAPELRTVVLRGVDTATRTLLCHTDRRSPKFEQIRRQPKVAWLFWDESTKMQLRLDTTATLHTDGPVADRLWEELPPPSLALYHQALAPSTPIGHWNDIPSRSDAGRTNFAVIAAQVTSIEWLWLHDEGHKRCCFTFDAAGAVEHHWLVP